jgi:thiamine biosynthesis lipoprotein
MLERVVKRLIHDGAPYSSHPEDCRPMPRVTENPFHAPQPEAAPAQAMSRRRFLVSLGALAAAGVASPFLGRWAERSFTGGRARVERSRAGLGTWIRIVASHRDEAAAERAIDRAFAAIDRVDAQMSIHRPDSELARVNSSAGRTAVAVSGALLDVVERALSGSVATREVYDPTVLPLMRLYGFYDSGRTHFPSDREIAATLEAMGPRVVAVDRGAGTLGLLRPAAALDLGSIGKGWAIDRAADALRAEGVTSGLVDVGRNVYGLGTPEDGADGWRVGVLHPQTGEVVRTFTLRDAAVATSANSEQWTTLDGRRVGHLLDARLGRPASERRAATVVARSATAADEGSTRAFLLGRPGLEGLEGVLDSHVIG